MVAVPYRAWTVLFTYTAVLSGHKWCNDGSEVVGYYGGFVRYIRPYVMPKVHVLGRGPTTTAKKTASREGAGVSRSKGVSGADAQGQPGKPQQEAIEQAKKRRPRRNMEVPYSASVLIECSFLVMFSGAFNDTRPHLCSSSVQTHRLMFAGMERIENIIVETREAFFLLADRVPS